MNWLQVADLADLPDGRPVRVVAAGHSLVLVRIGATVRACEAVCPHKYGPLDQGEVVEGRLKCPLHEATFDLATGLPDEAWAGRLPVFEVRVEGGSVQVRGG